MCRLRRMGEATTGAMRARTGDRTVNLRDGLRSNDGRNARTHGDQWWLF
ncbi:MAG: hypothetical protein PHN20_03925 [Bacteroidales bacterium]|nr:hypothetical protein [Bacteroidales bacterium]